MANRLELLLEAERRGILPPEQAGMLAEARRRGLVESPQQTAPPIPQPVMPRGGLTGRETTGAMRTAEDIARSFTQGATLGFSDEGIAALGSGISRMGLGAPITYEQAHRLEQERQARIPPEIAIPGQVAGGLTTGLGVARALPQAAMATVPRLAGLGAAEGAAAGAGFAPPGERATGAGVGALTGGAFGAAAKPVSKAVGKVLTPKIPKAPTAKKLKELSGEAYDLADEAGLVIKQSSFGNSMVKLGKKLTDAGIDPVLHPKATRAFQRLADDAASDLPLRQFEILRRIVKDAASSPDEAERRIAKIITNHMDDYLGGIGKADTISGDPVAAEKALTRARGLWSRAKKGDAVEELIERARNRAPQFSQSGAENALRTEFRQLSQNAKKMRLFTKPEQEAIQKVARGGPMHNTLRSLGKFAPRGPVSGMAQILSTGGLTTAFGPVGTGIAVGGLAGSEAAKATAAAMTRRNAQLAAELMRRGAPLPQVPLDVSTRNLLFGAAPAVGGMFGPR